MNYKKEIKGHLQHLLRHEDNKDKIAKKIYKKIFKPVVQLLKIKDIQLQEMEETIEDSKINRNENI